MTTEKKKIVSEYMSDLAKKSVRAHKLKYGKNYRKEMKRRRALNKTSKVKKLSTD